jgi:hypothetical protein
MPKRVGHHHFAEIVDEPAWRHHESIGEASLPAFGRSGDMGNPEEMGLSAASSGVRSRRASGPTYSPSVSPLRTGESEKSAPGWPPSIAEVCRCRQSGAGPRLSRCGTGNFNRSLFKSRALSLSLCGLDLSNRRSPCCPRCLQETENLSIIGAVLRNIQLQVLYGGTEFSELCPV